MDQQDILLWPDGFWCFADEYNETMLRDQSFRLIPADTPEWVVAKEKPAIARAALFSRPASQSLPASKRGQRSRLASQG
jgi:hypothetical protein